MYTNRSNGQATPGNNKPKRMSQEERLARKLERAHDPKMRLTRATTEISFKILDMQGQLDGSFERFQSMATALFAKASRAVTRDQHDAIAADLHAFLVHMNNMAASMSKLVGYKYRPPRDMPKPTLIPAWLGREDEDTPAEDEVSDPTSSAPRPEPLFGS